MFGELIHRIRYLAPTVSQWRSEALIARIFGSEPYPFWRNLRAYFSPHYGMRFAGPPACRRMEIYAGVDGVGYPMSRGGLFSIMVRDADGRSYTIRTSRECARRLFTYLGFGLNYKLFQSSGLAGMESSEEDEGSS